jgi:hypothetical protein
VSVEDLKRGLILYFNFDAKPVEGKIPDLSGQKNDGLAAGIEWVADGHRGGSVSFGPKDSYITVPNNEGLNPTRMTMAAWIKTSCKDTVWRRIFDKGTGVGYDLTMGGGGDGGGPGNTKSFQGLFCLEVGPGGFDKSAIEVADGRWHWVVGTFDGSRLREYVDGQPLGGGTQGKGDPAPNVFALTIGANRSNPKDELGEVGASFNGMMDDVMMWNRALSAEEIHAFYLMRRTPADAEPAQLLAATGGLDTPANGTVGRNGKQAAKLGNEPPPPVQNLPRDPTGPWNQRVILAHSRDGLTWTVEGESVAEQASVPALFVGPDGRIILLFVDSSGRSRGNLGALVQNPSGAWERADTNLHGADPDVVRLTKNDFRAYTVNRDGSIQAFSSKDGLQWEPLGTAFQDDRHPDSTDPDVFQTNDGWVMLVSLGPKLLVCTSPDGLRFTAGKTLDFGGAVSGTVKVNGGWRTYFHVNPSPETGGKMEIRSAFTTNGRNWNIEAGVRVSPPRTGPASLGAASPSPLQSPAGTWLMAFTSFIQPPSSIAPSPATAPNPGQGDNAMASGNQTPVPVVETWRLAGIAIDLKHAPDTGSMVLSEVIALPDHRFRLYYGARKPEPEPGSPPLHGAMNIEYADSSDGSSWYYGGVAMASRPDPMDPEYEVGGPSFIRLPDGKLRMYYQASPQFSTDQPGMPPHFQLLSAVSVDGGKTFKREGTRISNSFYDPSSNMNGAAHGRVLKLKEGLYVAYLSGEQRVRNGTEEGVYLFTSVDGLKFSYSKKLYPGAHDPMVLQEGDAYRLYASDDLYDTVADSALMDSSKDGLTWGENKSRAIFLDRDGTRLKFGGMGDARIGDICGVMVNGKLRLFSSYKSVGESIAFYDLVTKK